MHDAIAGRCPRRYNDRLLGRPDHSPRDASPKAAPPLADHDQRRPPGSRKLDDPRCAGALEDLAGGHHAVPACSSDRRIQCLSSAEKPTRQQPLIVGVAKDRRLARTNSDENELRTEFARKLRGRLAHRARCARLDRGHDRFARIHVGCPARLPPDGIFRLLRGRCCRAGLCLLGCGQRRRPPDRRSAFSVADPLCAAYPDVGPLPSRRATSCRSGTTDANAALLSVRWGGHRMAAAIRRDVRPTSGKSVFGG